MAALTNWERSPKPREPGVHVFREIPLESLLPFADWNYFYFAWKVPAASEEALRLKEEAEEMFRKIVRERATEARAVIGFFPVQRNGDSLKVYAAEDSRKELAELHFLRQQESAAGTFKSLADYFNPHLEDWIGLFAVSAGLGIGEFQKDLEARGDSYGALLAKTLTDRLTEALSEKMHRDVMRSYWGYLPENAEPFGIRPAPGYPACPDSSELRTIWKLLSPEENIGIRLTENCMMLPLSSTSGYYIAHPQSRYFSIGKIGEDQLRDYAARKGISVEEVKKWLRIF
ncbi:MAG: hypothetical protein LBR60_06765 [Fibrobacter sp.]|nr:hypothetical protein [Fibrobacter sp.]